MLNNIQALPANMGKLITVTPPNPSGGANFQYDVPVGTIILPVSFSCLVVTDATVITRTMLIATFDGATNIFITPSEILHTASYARTYTCQAGNNMKTPNVNYHYQTISLSSLNYMRFGDQFRTVFDQIQAGDAITSCCLRYMQWIQAT